MTTTRFQAPRRQYTMHLLRPALDPLLRRRRLSPTQLFVLSFVGLIAIGTVGLLFLPGLYTGQELNFVDALFTATSAVCVTGLIVVDTATYFTPLGQAWIASLIQLGGLGLLTFTSLIVISLGGRTAVAVEEAVGSHARVLASNHTRSLLRSVLITTAVLEVCGASLFWLAWQGRLGAVGAIWPAVFHAISAFCNAGFSIFSDSLVGFRSSPLTLAVAFVLIVMGGIGFLVIEDLRARYLKRATHRLTGHTRLVLFATAALLLGGTALFWLFEGSGRLADMGMIDRLMNAGFMSVTARTAGFNTVDYASLSNASVFLTILLMLVGGSPNSTAGGFKTTTIAILGLLLLARLRGQGSVSVAGRTVPEETVQRAASVVVGGTILLGVCVFLLLIMESHGGAADRNQFVQLAFDAHSAFATVGLSMGATPTLDGGGRLLITLLMFLGRVGPLSAVAAMTLAGRRRLQYRYAHEDVLIG